MTSSRTSGGDPARTLALLWRTDERPRRGPQRGLDLDAVVAGATAIADREGLDAVTMRRLAKELSVSAMSLYTYVPGKDEMVDVMLDAAYQRMSRPQIAGQPWRQRLTAIADANRGLYLSHPWASTISTQRPPLGPGLMAKYEYELAALDGLGLTDVEMDDALTYLLSFVQANAQATNDARVTQRISHMNDEQWWETNAPLLARVLDETAYPLAARVGSAAGAARGGAYNPDHAYRFGLARVLDGLATLIDDGARRPRR